jgi:hypothetical protein
MSQTGGYGMNRALIFAAGLLLALGACTQTQTETPAVSEVATSAPSPRPECAPAHVTLYFSEEIASDEPVVTPLLNDFMARVRACEAAGGEVRAITIVASADPGQGASAERAQIRRRQDRVRAALVNVGAPEDKIVNGVAAAQAPLMGRRAEITADLY